MRLAELRAERDVHGQAAIKQRHLLALRCWHVLAAEPHPAEPLAQAWSGCRAALRAALRALREAEPHARRVTGRPLDRHHGHR